MTDMIMPDSVENSDIVEMTLLLSRQSAAKLFSLYITDDPKIQELGIPIHGFQAITQQPSEDFKDTVRELIDSRTVSRLEFLTFERQRALLSVEQRIEEMRENGVTDIPDDLLNKREACKAEVSVMKTLIQSFDESDNVLKHNVQSQIVS